MTRSKRVLQHVSLQDVLDRLEASLVDVLMEDNVLGLRRDDPYVPYIVSFFCAGLVAVYRRWLIADSEIPLESLAGATSACLFDGLNGVLPSVKPGVKRLCAFGNACALRPQRAAGRRYTMPSRNEHLIWVGAAPSSEPGQVREEAAIRGL